MNKERIRHIHIRLEHSLFKKLQFKALTKDQKLNTILTDLIKDYVKDAPNNIKEIEEI